MKRKTKQRTTILDVFRKQKRPLTVDEILKYGRKGVETLNQSTVYRNLKILINDGFLRRISHPSLGILYERTETEHHHHFHCRQCKRAYEVPCCLLRKDKIAPDKFVVEDHDVFLFGICPSCVRHKKA